MEEQQQQQRSQAEDLSQYLSEKVKSIQYLNLMKTVKDQDVIILIGQTGSGKSTLANVILQRSLRITRGGYIANKTVNLNEQLIIINGGFNSTTLIPQAIKYGDYYLIDTPGQGDTRGLEYSIFSILSLKEIVLTARSVKIGLCLDYGSVIGNRSAELIQNLQNLKEAFDITNDTKNFYLLIVQKVDNLTKTKKIIEEANLISDERVFYFKSPPEAEEGNQEEYLEKLYVQGNTLFQKFKEIKGEKLTSIYISKLFTISELMKIYELYVSQTEEICKEIEKIYKVLQEFVHEHQIEELNRYKTVAQQQIQQLLTKHYCYEILKNISEDFDKNYQDNKDEKIKQIFQNLELRLNNLKSAKLYKQWSKVLMYIAGGFAVVSGGAGLTIAAAVEIGSTMLVRIGIGSLISSIFAYGGSKKCDVNVNQHLQELQNLKKPQQQQHQNQNNEQQQQP